MIFLQPPIVKIGHYWPGPNPTFYLMIGPYLSFLYYVSVLLRYDGIIVKFYENVLVTV